MRDQALFDKIDLHLIRILHTVLTERSVSRAAIRLGMYQPAVSAALYGALVMLDDADIPINQGVFAPFTMIRPEGSLVAPRRPAAANARGMTTSAMVDAMLDALVTIKPERAIAGCGINHVMTVSMADGAGHMRSYHDRDYGGAGARWGSDGVDAHGYAFFGGRANVVPVELIEGEHQILFEYIRLLRVTRAAARLADPGARIAVGGLGYPSFLSALLRYTDNPDDGSVSADLMELV